MKDLDILQEVKDYYGKTLQSSDDLKTNACCTIKSYPKKIQEALNNIHPEVLEKYYGCGLTIPTELTNRNVLDLGSGSGRDCYILSKLVGPEGKVVGVDMTKEQLEVANRHLDYQREKFDHPHSNVEFLEGNIEKLHQLDLAEGAFDIIISNCVINLCVDKNAVLEEAYRLLKPGGELYFSDVYCNKRIPKHLQEDQVLWGECLSGALYWNDFLSLAKSAGFKDPRAVESETITIENTLVQEKIGDLQFFSVTYRLFKIPALEPACEDYGQSVVYLGTLEETPDTMIFDAQHTFHKGRETFVCGNSFDMLAHSRYQKHFNFNGDKQNHLGIFEGCGIAMPFKNAVKSSGGCC